MLNTFLIYQRTSAAYLLSKCVLFILFSCVSPALLEAKHSPDSLEILLEPYTLPLDHPVKAILDDLFSQTRVTFNLKSLFKAGFTKTHPRKFTNLIVTKHPDIPGFVFKLYLDTQRYYKRKPEYDYWILRIIGAQKIRTAIENYALQNVFKVPHKWIYILPDSIYPHSEGYAYKHTILVEDDMCLVSRSENKILWGSDRITPELLHPLWMILKELGLSDCAKPDNIPFSKDGTIAFVDTELFDQKHVRYDKLTPHLSSINQEYWKKLIK